MLTNTSLTNDGRCNSMTSTLSLWDKIPEINPVPIDIANHDDFDDENFITENEAEDELENSEDEIVLPRPLHRRFGSNSILETTQDNSQLWIVDKYVQVKLIGDEMNFEKARNELQQRLSIQHLPCVTNNNEQIRPWHFGLSSIRFQFERLSSIDIMRLISLQSSSFWLRFKNELQVPRRIRRDGKRIRPVRYGNWFNVCLCYGSLTALDQFQYSSEHYWSNQSNANWLLSINNDYYGGIIEWIIEEPEERKKKQLLASNIDHAVIIHLLANGFIIYFCQKCNLNEFIAKEKKSNNVVRSHRSTTNPIRNSGLVRPAFSSNRRQGKRFYEKDKRFGIRNGIYFPTVQFQLSIKSVQLKNEKARSAVQKTLKLLIDFCTSHNITVCYGSINSQQGPSINSFATIPFPTPIMRYSWQMLINIGYRLQIQIDDKFRQGLYQLSTEPNNPDDLFYGVCLYLSRLFTLEPFVNLSDKLHDAIIESKRKREEGSFGLISSLNSEDNLQMYIPSVTLTPTTIRIKSLKLCRTNRVIRSEKEFGKALEHFVLVDIRDENGSSLNSFHFTDLQDHFLYYLKDGFTLIDDNRRYQYLHHSQSQLRAAQFWFYHHKPNFNLSFDDAYEWMGNFDRERNIAKNASRIALCFSTTTPTININDDDVHIIDDITTDDGNFIFTDGCGTLSIQLRDDIQEKFKRGSFSAVQFRFAGAKGVVSVDPLLGSGLHLNIRDSMNKFESNHRCFEVCKVSAPRALHLNRQEILLLSYRQIPDAVFLILQQRNQLSLIRSLLRNDDAKTLLGEKLPYRFLPFDAKIDFFREPFFRQVLITACLNSTRVLLQKTRIRVPRNEARNMFGIIDEYNVLKPDEVFIQYTRLNDYEDNDDHEKHQKIQILQNRKVVVTKNPCHHPGDVRTFTAVYHKALVHLKDVIVFSQQGDHPVTHQISGSDLDGDEYAVIWHKDLVPLLTPNAIPYNYDGLTIPPLLNRPVNPDDRIPVVLDIAKSDFLGRLSNLHLAYAVRYGVDSNEQPNDNILSTIQLAGAISEEVDSGKTGVHPLDDIKIKKQNDALGNERPDFMECRNKIAKQSEHILSKLYLSSRRTLLGWNRLLRQHRHLRHLQIRTPEDEQIEDDEDLYEQINTDDDQKNAIELDQSLIDIDRSNQDNEIETIAFQLFYVYRQEMLEILSLYGLLHESDLWCGKSTNKLKDELEDSAYTRLQQLVIRTRHAFFLRLLFYCQNDETTCDVDTPFKDLCLTCQDIHRRAAIALYRVCYSGENRSERAPILSLPWLFGTALLQVRHRQLPSTQGLLSVAMEKTLQQLIDERLLRLGGLTLTLRTKNNCRIEATVHWTICVFIEILHHSLKLNSFPSRSKILCEFIRKTQLSTCEISSLQQYNESDEWELIFPDENRQDDYAGHLMSMEWTENDDELMHSYFIQILELCFSIGQTVTKDEYLTMSEEIILILQNIVVHGTEYLQNHKK